MPGGGDDPGQVLDLASAWRRVTRGLAVTWRGRGFGGSTPDNCCRVRWLLVRSAGIWPVVVGRRLWVGPRGPDVDVGCHGVVVVHAGGLGRFMVVARHLRRRSVALSAVLGCDGTRGPRRHPCLPSGGGVPLGSSPLLDYRSDLAGHGPGGCSGVGKEGSSDRLLYRVGCEPGPGMEWMPWMSGRWPWWWEPRRSWAEDAVQRLSGEHRRVDGVVTRV